MEKHCSHQESTRKGGIKDDICLHNIGREIPTVKGQVNPNKGNFYSSISFSNFIFIKIC